MSALLASRLVPLLLAVLGTVSGGSGGGAAAPAGGAPAAGVAAPGAALSPVLGSGPVMVDGTEELPLRVDADLTRHQSPAPPILSEKGRVDVARLRLVHVGAPDGLDGRLSVEIRTDPGALYAIVASAPEGGSALLRTGVADGLGRASFDVPVPAGVLDGLPETIELTVLARGSR